MFTKIDKYFTDRKKLVFAAGALVFALLWTALWNTFPMEFYVIFFKSTVGSNVQLVILNIVVLLPLFYIFTRLTGTELSFCKTVLLNIFLAAAVEYVFSIFLFSDSFYWCVLAYILHSAANVWTFGSAGVRDGKAPKGMRAPEAKLVPAIKKHPIISVMWGAAFSLCADAAGVALVYVIAHIYYGG